MAEAPYQINAIDRTIMQLRQQARENMLLADELEALRNKDLPKRKRKPFSKKDIMALYDKHHSQKEKA